MTMPQLAARYNGICHDRFIIVDQKEIFWTGASLKDAGRLTFVAAKTGAEVIPGLLDSIRKATSERQEYGKGKVAEWRTVFTAHRVRISSPTIKSFANNS